MGTGFKEPLRPGQSIIISKAIVVKDYSPAHYDSFIRGDDGKRYSLFEWDWEYDVPMSWPPKAGDIWETSTTRYAAVDRDGEIVLVPVNVPDGVGVYPDQYQTILDQHPVLVLR